MKTKKHKISSRGLWLSVLAYAAAGLLGIYLRNTYSDSLGYVQSLLILTTVLVGFLPYILSSKTKSALVLLFIGSINMFWISIWTANNWNSNNIDYVNSTFGTQVFVSVIIAGLVILTPFIYGLNLARKQKNEIWKAVNAIAIAIIVLMLIAGMILAYGLSQLTF